MSNEPITLDEVMGAIIALQKSVDSGFEEASAERAELKAEIAAVRNVVDNDLAGQGQVMALEGQMQEVQRTLRQHGKKIDGLADRLDRAKV